MIGRLSIFVMLLAGALLAQSAPDPHLDSAYPAAALLGSSSFLHGYAHGYEDGFHFGNLDYHLQRANHEMNRFKAYRQASRDYAEAFGDKQFFKQGYQAGFRASYFDAVAGRSFRLVDVLRAIATASPERNQAGFFDDGWASGYTAAGQNVAMPDCLTRKVKKGEEFCSGFNLGFALGSADVHLAANESGKVESAKAQPSSVPVGVSH